MPKQILGTGNKKAVKSTPKTAYTSPAQIKIKKRHAAALDLRLQGLAFHQIGKQLGCHPSTAHDYVVKALRDIVPKETAQQVMQMELARLDALLEKYQPLALKGKGDKGAAELCLKISNQRCRLAGLYPQQHGGMTLAFGGGDTPTAEQLGIRVVFVKPGPDPCREEPLPVDVTPPPTPQLPAPMPGRDIEPPTPAPTATILPMRPSTALPPDIWTGGPTKNGWLK